MKINNALKTNSLSFKTVVNKTKIIIAFLILCAMFSFTALGQDPTEEMIDLGARPLSEGEMNQVMTWIAVRTSALRLPFCWKQSFGRGAGEPLSGKCAAGLEQNGALCYPQCKTNYGGVGPVCWGKCPSGFNDIGAFCQKTSYGRGAGYVIWNEGKCNAENSQGCEKNGALWYPKCKQNFSGAGPVCWGTCPSGYNDTGTGCAKPSYGRGAGEPFACRAGTEKNGLLCYPNCGKADFNGVGPVCWQKCPSQQGFDCGAACATTQGQCASAVVSMVTAPIIAAVNIASLGSAAAALAAPAKAVQIGASVGKMTKAVTFIKSAMTAAKGNVTTLVGGAQNLKTIKQGVETGGKVFVVGSAIHREVDMFSKEFADNFAEMTSKEIDAEINQRFGTEAAYQIKRQWGVRHLSLMLEADGFAMAKDALAAVSVVDPTGLVSVANAFMQPVCKADTPFPAVTALPERGIRTSLSQPQAQGGIGASLKTSLNTYLVAENGGNAEIGADRTAAGDWERFRFVDLNGGQLESGDSVNIMTSGGNFLTAEDGGGGALSADRKVAGEWEVFKIEKVGGSGPIVTGDKISLRTSNGKNFIVAEGGGKSTVNATRTAVGAWESFIFELR